MKVLFIGATGLVGSHVIPFLKDDFDLTLAAINGGVVDGLEVTAVDIVDWPAIEACVQKGTADGAPFDAIVYCATANYREFNSHDPEGRRHYFENCIEVNVRGAYHVFEAAKRANVPKVVHIGSSTSMMGAPRIENIGATVVNQANDLYAASKIFGEQVGRSYAFKPLHGYRKKISDESTMQVVCLRIAQPFTSEEQWIKSPFHHTRQPIYVGDIARGIASALRSDVRYGVYPITSAVDNPWILEEAYAELGYKPRWKFTFKATLEDLQPDEA